MKKVTILLIVVILSACSTKKIAERNLSKSDDDRTQLIEYLDDQTFLLTDYSDDKTYAFTQTNPVKVGGVTEGPMNERRFLNALTGPNGEKVSYFRAGSCCHFSTPNGFDGVGLLDRYRVFYEGSKDTVDIYINMYDKGDLKIPVGFQAKKIRELTAEINFNTR